MCGLCVLCAASGGAQEEKHVHPSTVPAPRCALADKTNGAQVKAQPPLAKKLTVTNQVLPGILRVTLSLQTQR